MVNDDVEEGIGGAAHSLLSPKMTALLPLGAVVLSGLVDSITQLYLKLMQDVLPSYELVFGRCVTQTAICLLYIRMRRGPLSWRNVFGEHNALLWLLLRGTLGFLGLGFVSYATQLMPLADAQSLMWTAPIFTFIAARIFLKEKIFKATLCGSFLALFGAVFIARPTALFSGGQYAVSGLGSFFAILAAVAAGTVYVVVRHLGVLQVDDTIIVFWQGLMGVLLAVPFLFMFNQGSQVRMPRSSLEWFCMFSSGPLGFVAQRLMVWGMTRDSIGPASAMRVWDVPFCFMWQAMFVQNEKLVVFDFVGAGLIIAGTLVILHSKLVNARKANARLEEANSRPNGSPVSYGVKVHLEGSE